MEIIKKKIKDLNPAVYNPRKDLKPGDKEYEALKNSVEKFGYIDPIIYNKRNNVIVGGHQRFKVLKDLGYKEIDCVEVDLNEQEEKTLNIALNKIEGDWDFEALQLILSELDEDLRNFTGMKDEEIIDILEELDLETDFEEYVEDNNKEKDIYIRIGNDIKILITEDQYQKIKQKKKDEILNLLLKNEEQEEVL